MTYKEVGGLRKEPLRKYTQIEGQYNTAEDSEAIKIDLGCSLLSFFQRCAKNHHITVFHIAYSCLVSGITSLSAPVLGSLLSQRVLYI